MRACTGVYACVRACVCACYVYFLCVCSLCVVRPYPPTFVLCTLVSLIRSLVFRVLYSASI